MTSPAAFTYHELPPPPALAPYVDCFCRLQVEAGRDVWLVPDGRIDVLFELEAPAGGVRAVLLGLGTRASPARLAAGTCFCAANLRLPAAEYLLHRPVADLRDSGEALPAGFWAVTPADLTDLGRFAAQLGARLTSLLPSAPDPRKQRLFELLYAGHGSLPVHELAEQAGWDSRQINRYFQKYFGLSLKAYCRILRFRAAMPQLKAGRLFPEQDFADQAHFIREVRQLSGVRPKDLARNQDDRFIQFSV